MTPLLICAYRPKYLGAVLHWLFAQDVPSQYRIFVWDNGGAEEYLNHFKLEGHCLRDEATGKPRNIGKAMAMRHLVDIVNREMPDADCYVCMDDDVIVGRDQLDAITGIALRPQMGMIGPRFHSFNSTMIPEGTVVGLDPCPHCHGRGRRLLGQCKVCRGSGVDPDGVQLRVYPAADRQFIGRIAGTLFAVAKSALQGLPWGPTLYPQRLDQDNKPVVYWSEDAALDRALSEAGLIGGYLQGGDYEPAIHLPDLDPDYLQWKVKARREAPTRSYYED